MMVSIKWGPFVLVLLSWIALAHSQWPLGPNFMQGFQAGMNNMMQNLQTNLQTMNQQIAANTQQMAAFAARNDEIARARLQDMQPGTWKYFDDANGRGYIFKDPNGGYAIQSIGSGSQLGRGYFFSTGPQGTFQRSW